MRFSDITGHEAVKNQLKALADTDRIPHALLLQGKQGTGKFALARALAQYIHCENRSGGDSCGTCPSCIQHQSFNHIDTFYSFPVIKKKGSTRPPVSDDYSEEWHEFLKEDPYMDPSNWTRALGNPSTQVSMYVTESDDLLHKLSFTSHYSRYKIVLMWLPEKMNEQCANKMLKLIEEPMEDSLFIITSDNPGEILPTIYSRCQRIEVNRLADEDIARFLTENFSTDRQEALSVAHNAEGSVTEAVRQLSVADESRLFFAKFVELMRLAYQRKIVDLRKWSLDISDMSREQQLSFLRYCTRLMRENFIYNLHDTRLNYMNGEESEFSKRFSPFINERNVVQLVNTFDGAIADIAGNTNSKIVFFDVAIRVILLLKS
ncbi:MAG: DNA polymerase III subunit delta [Muribaculaceae bacterium]|nr:DNA polymerase III subunit delta [Muribaculaceae bacterium]